MREWYPGELWIWNTALRIPFVRWYALRHLIRKGWLVYSPDNGAGRGRTSATHI